VLRKLSTQILTIDDLQLPPVFHRMGQEKNGLILVTGATGSGKSTTLAALIDEMNQTKAVHIVTLEDPIEFVHSHKKATINQRELGNDFDTFANGLRAALRQAPKVILVGEMRDRETVEIALSAAETGHLVLSTLHTVDAGQTINRILGMFDKDEEKLVRIRLADTLRWIVSQRLLPRVSSGRAAALEVMGTNLRVKESVLNGESEGKTFYEIIEAAEPFGMQTFDQSIIKLFKDGLITEDTALTYASRKSVTRRGIDDYKKKQGLVVSDISALGLDKEYGQATLTR
jgi:twitching motility protein PilT